MDTSQSPSESVLIQFISMCFDHIWAIIIILILFLFKVPITDLLKRATSIKYKKGESLFSIDTEKKQEQTKELPEIKQQEQTKDKEKSESIKVRISKEPSSWFPIMHKAIVEKKFEEAEQIFIEYAANETNQEQLLKHKSMYYYLLFTEGKDSSVLDKLEEIYKSSTNNASKLEVAEWLDLCYENAGIPKKSLLMWEEMNELVSEERLKSRITIYLAFSLKNESSPQKGKNLLLERLRIETEDDKIGNLYKALSNIETNLGNQDLAVYCLDKSLEFRSNDDDTFDSAYKASEQDIEDISVSNYHKLINVNSDNGLVYNNLGVKAQELKLPSIAIDLYKKAADLNNSLGLTNYGYLLLEAGFTEEARKAAQKALAMEEPHENAHSLMTAITKKQTVEAEEWERISKTASERQNIQRQYIERYYFGDSRSLEGEWVVNSEIVQIKIEKGKLDITWTEPVFLLTDKVCNRRLIADVHGASFSGDVGTSYNHVPTSLLDSGFSDSSESCIGFLKNDNQEILLMSKKFPEKLKIKLQRKPKS